MVVLKRGQAVDSVCAESITLVPVFNRNNRRGKCVCVCVWGMANGGRDWVTSRQLGSRIGCCRHTSAHTFRVSVCGDKEEHVYREAFNTTEITWWKMNRFLVPLLNYLPSLMSEEFWLLNATSPMWLPHWRTPLSEIQWESPDMAELTQSGTVKSVNAYRPLMCRPIRDGPASKCWATKDSRAVGARLLHTHPTGAYLTFKALTTGFIFTKWIITIKVFVKLCTLLELWISMSKDLYTCVAGELPFFV